MQRHNWITVYCLVTFVLTACSSEIAPFDKNLDGGSSVDP